MPLCSYQQAPDRNDRTVVENIFLREFMPAAPEGAVKAYLYGLMQCQQGTGAGSLSAFARAVALSETEVQDAFAYWQEKGLVLVQTKPMFAVFYLDIHNALPQDGSVYTDSEYNREIQALFAPKAIQPAELARVYDWTDVFLIDRSAVPLLIEYGQKKLKDLDKATARRQVSYIDKIARQWNEEGVRTQEDAKAWLAAQAEQDSGLAAVLQRLGLFRSATQPERALYQKWLDAGFTQAAVLAAADRTVSVRNPSFDTLDGILSDFDAQGLHDAAAIEGDQTHALCREVLQALGLSRTTPTAGQLASYREWAAAGNSHERILLACEICKQHKTLRFSDVDATLSSWQAHKLRGVKSIRNFEKKRAELRSLIAQCFARMGDTRRKIDEADLQLAELWVRTWQLPEEVVLYAAECSHGARSPYRMIKRLLEQWHSQHIDSVSAARIAFKASGAGPKAKDNQALHYAQRSETERGDLDSLIQY